jgi:hypothetical protein
LPICVHCPTYSVPYATMYQYYELLSCAYAWVYYSLCLPMSTFGVLPLAVVVEWDLLRVRLCIWIYTAVYVLLSYVQFAQCLKYWSMCTVLCIVHIQIIYMFLYYKCYLSS